MRRDIKIIILVLVFFSLLFQACNLTNTSYPRVIDSQGFPLALISSHNFREAIISISSSDKDFYFIRTNNALFAIKLGLQDELWKFPLSSQLEPSSVLSSNNKVYAIGNNKLYALNENTGQILWEQPMQANDAWLVSASNNLVLINLPSTSIVAYKAENGSLLWQIPTGRGFVTAYLDQNLAYIPDEGIDAVSGLNGKIEWVNGTNSIGASAFENHKLYYLVNGEIGDNPNESFVVAFDAVNRSELWRIKVTISGLGRLFVHDNKIVLLDSSQLITIDIKNGRVLWQLAISQPMNPETIEGNLYVIETFNGIIRCININNGTELGSLQISGHSLFSKVTRQMISLENRLIFFSGQNVYIYGK
jgi:outer membrane protein assembly factor BamB